MMQQWIFRVAIFAISFLLFQSIQATESAQMSKTEQKKPAENASSGPVVLIETNQGTFEVTLSPDIAPKTCENFIGHVNAGYYNGLIFHRVIPGFMIQGGDPTGTGSGGASIWKDEPKFKDEFSLKVKFDKPGILAMANAGPNTNGSQFFITTVATPHLNQRHTIFGEVTKYYSTITKIEKTKTGNGTRPIEDQKIIKMTVKQ